MRVIDHMLMLYHPTNINILLFLRTNNWLTEDSIRTNFASQQKTI